MVFDRNVPLELHVVDPVLTEKLHGRGLMAAETMRVKICTMGPDECPNLVKVEFFSQQDFYFLYEHTCDVFDYEEMKELQGLHPQFADYLTMLIKLFTQTITNPDTLRCQVQLNVDNSADMFFN